MKQKKMAINGLLIFAEFYNSYVFDHDKSNLNQHLILPFHLFFHSIFQYFQNLKKNEKKQRQSSLMKTINIRFQRIKFRLFSIFFFPTFSDKKSFYRVCCLCMSPSNSGYNSLVVFVYNHYVWKKYNAKHQFHLFIMDKKREYWYGVCCVHIHSSNSKMMMSMMTRKWKD